VTHAQSYDGGMESKHVREVGSGHHSPIHPHKTIKPLPNTCRNARLNPTHVRHEISNHHRCSTTQTIARSDSLDRSGKNKQGRNRSQQEVPTLMTVFGGSPAHRGITLSRKTSRLCRLRSSSQRNVRILSTKPLKTESALLDFIFLQSAIISTSRQGTISARRLVSHNTLNISRELTSKYTCNLSNLHSKWPTIECKPPQ
jgi:hypothetical protein